MNTNIFYDTIPFLCNVLSTKKRNSFTLIHYRKIFLKDKSSNLIFNHNRHYRNKIKTLKIMFSNYSTLNLNFDNLSVLVCRNSNINVLDLRYFPNLKYLDCSQNQLCNLNHTQNLEYLDCSNNHIYTLNLEGSFKLKYFYCNRNSMRNLNIKNTPNLKILFCYCNKLKNLSVSNSNSLRTLICRNNKIIYLSIFNTPNLKYLDCSYNRINELNIKSIIYRFKYINLYSNRFTYIDLSHVKRINYVNFKKLNDNFRKKTLVVNHPFLQKEEDTILIEIVNLENVIIDRMKCDGSFIHLFENTRLPNMFEVTIYPCV